MTVTINLTPVLVTLIICVFLYAVCKMPRQGSQKKRQDIEVMDFIQHKNKSAAGSSKEGAGK